MIKQSLISILIGASLFIGWHFLIDMAWKSEGSLDVVAGAIIEFFLFQVLLNIYNIKTERKWKSELDAHLDKIEQLITRVYAKQKDGE